MSKVTKQTPYQRKDTYGKKKKSIQKDAQHLLSLGNYRSNNNVIALQMTIMALKKKKT